MKNKDIFEAINNIDDNIINGAGKYLRPDSLFNAEPVEIRPASKRISTVKIAAPIAAALAVVCGVAFMVRTQRPSAYSPGAAGIGMADSEDISSDIADSDETSDTSGTESEDTSSDISSVDETSTSADKAKEELERWNYLTNIDEKYLPVGFDGIKLTNEDGSHYLSGDDSPYNDEPVEYEYGGFSTNFVYYADPKGANYNSADNPEAFAEGFVTDNSATFKRIAKGDKYGSLTVRSGSYTTFCRDAENSPNEAPIYFHGSSHLMFDGRLMIEDAYLVKMPDADGVYYCILRNGTTPLPIINATTLEDGSYGALPFEGNLGGIEYKTEIPPIVVRLRENQQEVIDKYFEDHSYAKVRVDLNDIQMWCYPNDWYKIYAEGDIISIQSGDTEPEDVAAFMNSTLGTTSDNENELDHAVDKMISDLKEKFGFAEVSVEYQFNVNDSEKEPDEDIFIKNATVTVSDENGPCGIYTYGDQ